MKKALAILLAVTLVGCATNKAALPSVEGKPRVKINAPAVTAPATPAVAPAETFDFKYSGDIANSLAALQAIQPQIRIGQTVGKPIPVPVSVDRKAATVDEVLRDLGEQGGALADVVFFKPPKGEKLIFIRFNNPKE